MSPSVDTCLHVGSVCQANLGSYRSPGCVAQSCRRHLARPILREDSVFACKVKTSETFLPLILTTRHLLYAHTHTYYMYIYIYMYEPYVCVYIYIHIRNMYTYIGIHTCLNSHGPRAQTSRLRWRPGPGSCRARCARAGARSWRRWQRRPTEACGSLGRAPPRAWLA